jgi:hypothetical protein
MTTATERYTTKLGHGLGMIEETRSLLRLWEEGMDVAGLWRAALDSGEFPGMSARRLRNIVADCFAPRLLVREAQPARLMKRVMDVLSAKEFSQLLFVQTCRANMILADFVREVYWAKYAAGRDAIANDEAREFVEQAERDGKTTKEWPDATVRRVSSYLTGCCGDFGLLESGTRRVRRILSFRIEQRVAAVLAYDLHFAGRGDNLLLSDSDWSLFGLERDDVLAELKRLSLKRLLIIQTAGSVIRIGWPCKSIEELVDVIAEG